MDTKPAGVAQQPPQISLRLMPTAVEHHLVFRYCQEKLRIAQIWRAIQNVCYVPWKAAGRVTGASHATASS